MNTDTGQFYNGAELFAAIQRGEPIEDLTLNDPLEDRMPEEDQRRLIEKTRSQIRVNWHRKKKVK